MLLNTHVSRLLFKDESLDVIGVEVINVKGEKVNYYATKETIVSAGVTNSPQILMLSGLGPKKHLEELKIKVKKDIPGVGQNLQDHVAFSVCNSVKVPTYNTQWAKKENFMDWLKNKKGPFTSIIGEIVLFNKTKYGADKGFGDIDYEIMGLPCSIYNHGGMNPEHMKQNVVTTFGILLRPRSKGSITLRSKDPKDKIVVDPNYLSQKVEQDIMVDIFKKCRAIFKTKPFSEIVKEEIYPGVKEVPLDASDDKIKDFIARKCQTMYHPCSTCKMGKKDDKGAVVDTRMNVMGVNNLRVIDASVFPVLISAHTHATAVMVGEKGAEFIKKKYKN